MTAITTGDRTVLRLAGSGPTPELRAVADDADAAVAEVGSTGAPAVEPLVAVTRRGHTGFHARCSPEHLREVVAALDEGDGGNVDHLADATADHEPATSTFPAPGLEGLDAGVRRVLGGCGWRRPTNPEDHAAAGGFADADPEAVEDAASRLRGRGWGDWSQDEAVADSWATARDADGDPAVVVNAHSSTADTAGGGTADTARGGTADTLLLESAPLDVLEGAQAAARAVGADQVLVYAAADDERAQSRVREAAANYRDPAAPVDVVTGPGNYRAAEPTMALEAIEGNHRLEARLRPPGPDEVGLHGRPTLVHSARTCAHLAQAVRDGDLPGTRLVSVAGDVAAPATVELRESDRLAGALDAVTVDGEFKAACVGGRFGGVTASLDVAPDPAALADADLGTEGTVEVLADDRCVLEFVGRRASFAADANCGRCVPCREGTTQLANELRGIYGGDYRPGRLAELVDVMASTSICEFGVAAGRPARTAMAEFEGELAAHADGRCPAGACSDAPEVKP